MFLGQVVFKSEILGQFLDKRFRYFIIMIHRCLLQAVHFPIVLFSKNALSNVFKPFLPSLIDCAAECLPRELKLRRTVPLSRERKDFLSIASLSFTSNSSVFFDLSLK